MLCVVEPSERALKMSEQEHASVNEETGLVDLPRPVPRREEPRLESHLPAPAQSPLVSLSPPERVPARMFGDFPKTEAAAPGDPSTLGEQTVGVKIDVDTSEVGRAPSLRRISTEAKPEEFEKHVLGLEETSSVRERLEELSGDLDLEFVRTMVSDFIKELPVRIDELEDLVSNVRTKEAQLASHSLKGVAQTFGLGGMSLLFQALESASEAAQPELMMRHLQALQEQLTPTIARLNDWLKTEAQGGHSG